MQLINTLLSIATFLGVTLALPTALNTSAEYNLKTCLKPGQTGKERYESLWLESYHTGAGLSDATFASTRSNVSAAGYLSATNVTSPSGQIFYDQAFNLGNDFPWQMIMAENVNFYAAWEPVRINAGLGSGGDSGLTGGFFINGTGLQWSSNAGENAANDAFGGWIVCDWWHDSPQLFFRISYYNSVSPAPSSCADVDLIPVYI